MAKHFRGRFIRALGAFLGAWLASLGCSVAHLNRAADEALHPGTSSLAGPLPSELAKTLLPPYFIEPPDILLIDSIRLVPKGPHRIEPLDVLTINVSETFPNQPIAGQFVVAPDGTVSLGFTYGIVRLVGLTLPEAEQAIRDHLSRVLNEPRVTLGLAQFRGMQQIRGKHRVRMDGTINLGTHGSVNVTGLTLSQARFAIEKFLSQYFQDPEISLDVVACNSKAYYVIADGAGFGQRVYKFPITGNDTVLDAIERIGGIPSVGSRKEIWVARPTPADHECVQVLPVDWQAIVQGGSTATNYQLFPGDRVYIKSNVLTRILSPIERLLGVTSLQNKPCFDNTGVNFVKP